METLKESGKAENTLVIFTSDNGGMFNLGGREAAKLGHQINGDLLGSKFGVWEGGHRVPFIAWWPQKIEANSTSDQLLNGVDMLASFAALTEQELEDPKDSINILPALIDNPTEPLRSEMIGLAHSKAHISLRKGKWMYIPAKSDGGFKGSKPHQHAWGGAQLYDLEADPNQTKNVINAHPKVVKEMAALLKKEKQGMISAQKKPKKK